VILVLGVGILMGGAWAYEALSFGGFWAWDPVENASLVPWLVLVAAGHTMIINKNKGGSLFTTHFLTIGSFLLVLYSTFLTRSGVLGNASVHAFTDLGMTGQLVLYVLTFIMISVALLIRENLFRMSYMVISFLLLAFAAFYGYKKIILLFWISSSAVITGLSYYLYFPKEKEEEELYSREFWMFLGSLVLILSSLIITYFTSIPVINKLFGTDYAPPKVPVYNTWMMPFTIVLMILIAATQFLKYKHTDRSKFFKRISYSFLLALLFGSICATPFYFLGNFSAANGTEKWNLISYGLLLVTGVFAAIANADYFITVLKGKISKSGAAIAHIGFAMVMLGALISTSKKVVLSQNTAERKVSSLGEEYDDKKNILLTQGDTLPMGPYLVTFKGRRQEGIDIYFQVDYLKLNKDNKPEFEFTLEPHVQQNPRMGNSPEPDTKHYIDRDIYTHVTYAIMNFDTSSMRKNKFSEAQNNVGHVGDTIFASNAFIVIDSLRSNLSKEEYEKNDSLLEVTAVLRCVDVRSREFFAYPKFVIQNNVVIPKEDVVEELGLKLVFWKVNPEDGTIEITLSEKGGNNRDFFVMEANVFPYINVLWLGCIIMAIGSFIAILERMRKFKKQ
jgi:cytochrome c-type biogenesis protein CcmF